MSVNIYNENAQAQTTEEKFTEVANRGTNLASNTIYDNTNSGLQAINVNDAIDEVIDNTNNNIAIIENGATASQTLTEGTHIIHNNQFYIVTQTIAQGTAITEGVNIDSKSVGEELSKLNNIGKFDEWVFLNTNNQTKAFNYSKFRFVGLCIRIVNNSIGLDHTIIPISGLVDGMFHRYELNGYESPSYNCSANISFDIQNNTVTLMAITLNGWSNASVLVYGTK